MNSENIFNSIEPLDLDIDRSELFRSYIKSYSPLVAKLVNDTNNKYGIKYNSMDIDDLLQESMIVLYEKSIDPTFNFTSKESTFVYGIVKNKINEKIRKTKKDFSFDYGPELDETPDDDYDNNKDYITEINLIKLKDCVSQLSETKRKVFEYFYYHNYSMKKIAELTGLANENSAWTQRFRAFKIVEDCVKSKN